MARLPDPTEALDEDGQRVWDLLRARRAARGATLPGVYLPLMHNPPLAEHFEQFADHLRFAGVLPRDIYEFVVLAVGSRIGARYELAHHEPYARAAGVPGAAVAALETRMDPPEPYSSVLRAVDAFLAHEPLSSDLQDRTSSIVGTDGLVEMAALVGMYSLLGTVSNGFGVVSEDDQAVSE